MTDFDIKHFIKAMYRICDSSEVVLQNKLKFDQIDQLGRYWQG